MVGAAWEGYRLMGTSGAAAWGSCAYIAPARPRVLSGRRGRSLRSQPSPMCFFKEWRSFVCRWVAQAGRWGAPAAEGGGRSWQPVWTVGGLRSPDSDHRCDPTSFHGLETPSVALRALPRCRLAGCDRPQSDGGPQMDPGGRVAIHSASPWGWGVAKLRHSAGPASDT